MHNIDGVQPAAFLRTTLTVDHLSGMDRPPPPRSPEQMIDAMRCGGQETS